MGVRSFEARREERPAPRGPGVGAALLVFAVSLALLLANGRPVGNAVASGAAGWLWRGAVGALGRASELDATGEALVGKLLAALFAAAAAAFLFAAVARRHPTDDARWAAFALALGTTLAAAAQAWSGEAAAACAVAAALWLVVRADAEGSAALAARAGLPLALAVVVQPSSAALAAVLGVALLLRWKSAAPAFLAWAAPGVAAAGAGVLLAGGAPATLADPSALALLASPAKGALVFAPVSVVGLVGLARALRAPRPRLWDQPGESRRFLPLACAVAALAHFAAVALAGGWAEGPFWGPRGLAPAWPLLLLFLPEGLAALKLVGTAIVALSVAVQVLGAVSYDGRWDRLARGPRGEIAEPWDLAKSPIAFQWTERVARVALPAFENRRLVLRERAVVRGATSGSFVTFGAAGPRPTGSDATMEAIRLEAGALVEKDRLLLRAEGDALAMRVRPGARLRRLELRVVGRGSGTLGFGDGSFWKSKRWLERPVSGAFRLRFPYSFAEANGAELALALRAGGPLAIESVALVPPGDPDEVIRLP